MFLGEYQHSIDEKSRLTIPSRFRDALEDGCVVTRGFEKNLIVYTDADFAALVRQAQTMSPTDPQARALQRMMFSGANEAKLDSHGRIIVPPFLRNYAEIDSDVFVVGVGQYIEIWSRAGWEAQLANLNNPEANSQRFATLNLAPAPDSGA